MTTDQLIAELRALPLIERQRIIAAVFSDESVQITEPKVSDESVDFIERWKGKFSLPKPALEDARLTFLLDRFSA